MKKIYQRMRILFPGKKFIFLMLNVLGLFLVALFDMVGIAAIMPIIQLATGSEITGYLAIISDILGNPGRTQLIVYLSIILVFSFIFKGVASLAIKWWSSGFIAHQQTAASVSLLHRYMNEPYLVNRHRTTAEILRTINDATGQAYAIYSGGILAALGELFTILVLMLLLLAVMPGTALIAFAYFGFFAFILQYFLKKKNTEQGIKIMESSVSAMNAALESIVGFRENRMHGVTARHVHRYQDKRLIAVEASRRGTFYQDLPKYMLEVIFIVGIALLLGILTSQNGSSSAAFLILFAGACVRVLPSFTRLVASIGNVRVGSKAIEIIEKDLETISKNGGLSLIRQDPPIGCFAKVNESTIPVALEVKNLNFKYPDGHQNVLNNINLSVPQGTSIAFVGGSGSGKTTLVDIILGLIEPDQGDVLCNGKSTRENPEEWFSRVGYVPQSVFLGDSTIKEAIAFGLREEEIDLERVWECIRIAELEDVINSMEHGIDQMIGEHGARLSGGQRQRLGIARAMYRRPSLLVLDEATSALDNETEHRITQTINRIAQEITVIIVAHRLSTVRNVNQLVFLSQGEVKSIGTFEQVQASNPEFANLVELGQLG
ncbi:ABC transporter ATP-binding protein [Rothia sp. P13129]|uniref:ABC transporter ATP-binding protein n=1 Tax=Rothia sp. P13129 TaxID=3402664 RepID=UPI003ABE28CF